MCDTFSQIFHVFIGSTSLVPTDATRKFNRQRYDVLTITNFTSKNGGNRGARDGRSEQQRAYQAKECSKKACEIYRSSRTNIGCTEEFWKHLDELATEAHSYGATRQERERYDKEWEIRLNSQGLVRPIRSRADFHAALRKFREAKQAAAEDGHQFNLTIRPISKSGNAQGNNSSNTKILLQIMPPQTNPI